MNYNLAIIGAIVIISQSCELGYSESSRRSDTNDDGKVDRIEYYIGSGSTVCIIDNNFDQIPDVKYSINREGKEYSTELNEADFEYFKD
jgi:hypothetical protein